MQEHECDLFSHDDEKELARLIEHHNRLYWEKGEPEISDEEYDGLMRRLEALNPDHPLLQAVLAPKVASKGKVRHAKPMLSLDKAYSLEEVLEWAGKYARSRDELFLVQPKYDGISANFADGVLSSRGDGVLGEDISDKIPLIELESKSYTGSLDRPARGEIVIRDDDFKNLYSKILKKDGKPYKNSRNAVAGIMGLKEIDDMRRQGAKLTLVDYEKVSYTVKFAEFAEKWTEILREVEALPYPMDGIVVKLADEAYRESLGATAHHPRGQIAFKFSGVRKKSKILNVEWSFGKNCLTPIAEIEPADIGGITIRHATLHNVKNIIDRDLQIGDTVTVERAGDVIPYIVESEPGENRRPCIISECPCCRSKLVREGPELRCVNPDCFETKLQRLLAAVKNIGIERLGEPNIRKMMNTLGVRTLRDIFNLSKDDILKLEGFKDKSAENLMSEIAAAKQVHDYEILAALNISGIGRNVAKMILGKYTLAELRKLSKEDLSSIHGIGPERAEAIFCELRTQSDFLDELLGCVKMTETKSSAPADGAQKRTVCFTGKMPEQRSYYEDLARKNGYEPVDSVTKELSLLVAADTSDNSSKLQKARKAGIKILSLDEWLKENS